jgi:hypothetical protein
MLRCATDDWRRTGMWLHTKKDADMTQASGTIYTDRRFSMEH